MTGPRRVTLFGGPADGLTLDAPVGADEAAVPFTDPDGVRMVCWYAGRNTILQAFPDLVDFPPLPPDVWLYAFTEPAADADAAP